MKRQHLGFAFLVVLLCAGSTSLVRGASIVIVNKDPGGVGFNDATAATPVGGNSGTTLGQQRLNVFQAAASVWGGKLSSAVTIKIAASFGALTPCGTSSGILGSAGPTDYFMNFTNAPRANTWYPVALASALSGTDLAAALTDGASIQAQFNSNIGTAGCLPTLSWYLGLDGNFGGSQLDLETVLLHEFGHGLGFVGVVSLSDGTFSGTSTPDIFSVLTYDNSAFMHWNTMSNAQRLASITNVGNVVFDGSNTTAGASILSAGKDGSGHPQLYTPSPAESGSSIYHFAKTATPNLLMEPVINTDLTHNVDLPNDLTMKAMLDFGWQPGGSLAAPTNVVAAASTATSVGVTWTASAGATSYEVARSSNGSTYTTLATVTLGATTYTDNTALANTAYLYKVRAVAPSTSAYSAVDLATTKIFTDPTLTATSTQIKLAHFNELRTAIGAVRTLAGLGAYSYTTPTLTAGLLVKATDLTDMRTALNAARSVPALSLSAVSYTDPTITATSTLIRAAHINDLRNGVK